MPLDPRAPSNALFEFESVDLMLFAAILLILSQPTAGPTWSTTNGELTASTPAYSLHMDGATLAPKALLLKDKPAITFGHEGWWRLTLADGKTLTAGDSKPIVLRTATDLHLAYKTPDARVTLNLHFDQSHLDIRATAEPLKSQIIGVAAPPVVAFDPASLKQVSFPVELGRALLPPFFKRQAEESYVGWTGKSAGSSGAEAAGFTPARGTDYNQPAVPTTLTTAGREWLGNTAAMLQGWSVRCPRAPEGKPDTTLIDTPSGPLLSLQTIDGGWGDVIRWGGVFQTEDLPKMVAASVATAQALWNRPIGPAERVAPPRDYLNKPRREVMPKQIGFIDLGDAPQRAEWKDSLQRLEAPVVIISTPKALRAHLQSKDCWLIVNPYGELLPAAEEDAKSTAQAIRTYVTNGGVWLHTSGYPFFVVINPIRYLQVNSSYPPAFSDFIHLSLASGQISWYGIQPAGKIFMPVDLTAGGSETGGSASRQWITWIEPGVARDLPVTRFEFGLTNPTAVRSYGAANGFTRPLDAKVSPSTLAALKRSLLVRYSSANCQDMRAGLSLLPKPALVHIAEYLHGGFDKQYPDHLPPSNWFGTEAQFSDLVREIHDSGRLFMPYTNPTWWCDGPAGPTFVREGQEPLLKDASGKPVKEAYGSNYGWSLCTFHPAALKAEQAILSQFTEQYPVDVLFQDQIGARGPQYDFNPVSPTPYAYIQGMIDIAKRDSAQAPLSTENGFDAVMNYETQFCGITWALVPTENGPDWRGMWRDRYPADAWRFEPLALWLGHDKILFDHHDLGQFVTNRETLAWTLALGYQLSAITSPSGLKDDQTKRWIDWLAAIQRITGPVTMGAPLLSWEEPSPGIYRAQYGDAHIIANTTAKSYVLDSKTTLSAFGFRISAPAAGVEGGDYDRYGGQNYPAHHAFVKSRTETAAYTGDR